MTPTLPSDSILPFSFFQEAPPPGREGVLPALHLREERPKTIGAALRAACMEEKRGEAKNQSGAGEKYFKNMSATRSGWEREI